MFQYFLLISLTFLCNSVSCMVNDFPILETISRKLFKFSGSQSSKPNLHHFWCPWWSFSFGCFDGFNSHFEFIKVTFFYCIVLFLNGVSLQESRLNLKGLKDIILNQMEKLILFSRQIQVSPVNAHIVYVPLEVDFRFFPIFLCF